MQLKVERAAAAAVADVGADGRGEHLPEVIVIEVLGALQRREERDVRDPVSGVDVVRNEHGDDVGVEDKVQHRGPLAELRSQAAACKVKREEMLEAIVAARGDAARAARNAVHAVRRNDVRAVHRAVRRLAVQSAQLNAHAAFVLLHACHLVAVQELRVACAAVAAIAPPKSFALQHILNVRLRDVQHAPRT